MRSEYRIRKREDGWIVEYREGLDIIVGGTRIEPEWDNVAGPFPTKEEAEREVSRRQSES